MFRSVLSVVLGFLVMALLSFAYLTALFVAFPDSFPPAVEGEPTPIPGVGMQLATLLCDFGAALFGGYFTAAVAGSSPRKHAVALAILIGVMGLINTMTTFGSEPVVYAWVRTIIAPFLVVIGGVLRVKFWGHPTGLEGAAADD